MNLNQALFLALLALPVLVAAAGMSVWAALLLILLWLLARWIITLQGLVRRGRGELELDTIAASHFVEKVRWCLDRADIPYTERQSVGTLGAFFLGRTVPRLRARTGSVTTSIGNSPEILRYLWGRYGHERPEQRAFLAPSAERDALEAKLDRYGTALQVWVYYHMLQRPEALSRVWGMYDPTSPAVQRLIARIAAPLLRLLIARSFGISEGSIVKARQNIEAQLADTENILQHDKALVGNQRSYVDYAFAGLSSLWLRPEQFGNGKADNVILRENEYPPSLLADAERWREQFPHTVSFLEHLYQNERQAEHSSAT